MKYRTKVNALLSAIVAVVLLAAVAPLTAQTTTARVPPPPCWPAQVGGSGSKAVRVTGDYGQAIMWWCGQEAVGLVASWAYTMVIPDSLPSSLTGALAAMWEANVSNEPIDEIQRTQLKQDAIIALQPLRPAVPRWVVAPNGTFPTRPVYTLTAGLLAATGLRVDVLTAGAPTPCGCDVASTPPDRSPRYCAIPQPAGTTPPRVAVCKLQ